MATETFFLEINHRNTSSLEISRFHVLIYQAKQTAS